MTLGFPTFEDELPEGFYGVGGGQGRRLGRGREVAAQESMNYQIEHGQALQNEGKWTAIFVCWLLGNR
ncbi:hypothetical protein J5N97_028163 [Dioscorea zingiberensis]|uniref:Uncharacterized protein n=1 Tax=Dioscorea zingiberensis TaxID=325984 RepID=A0A9D5BYN7_9LILI|nr:hypothetical protein J5N97_028163 [Dioscorea zingiberensis]